MRYFFWSCFCVVCLAGCSLALAGDVPPVSAADFGTAFDVAEGEAAAFIWQLLAGQGVWGVILFAVVGAVWKIAKPYLDEWMRQRKLATLWDAAVAAVAGTMQTFVDAARMENGGVLTKEKAAEAKEKARQYIISFMKTQGVDVLREFGQDVLDYIIEAVLAKLKVNNALAKAVVTPLSASAPLPPSVTQGAMPG